MFRQVFHIVKRIIQESFYGMMGGTAKTHKTLERGKAGLATAPNNQGDTIASLF
ncbi:MAG: hypothetical protein JRE47_09025 [Deltaproteobacteria bacterium]|nr:hypothetical protein [Deltaproteobacteria bacterium]